MGAAGTLLFVWATMRDLPLADILPAVEEPTISVRTVDGEVLTTRGAYRAPYVALDEFPPFLPEAVMAIEDQRFREHGGVDLRGISRALYRNVTAGGVVEGGSTLTQQLVKILYLEPERTLTRKLQEAVLAVMLERQLGKDRILELYLNSVYLGSGAYGMPAAAETYYGKDVGELTLPEAAMLAASIQSPSQVNPIANLGAAQNRAALVLNLMAEQGRIDEATRDQALAQLAVLAPQPPPTRAGSYFADWVLREVEALKGAGSGGLTATATLDPELQAEAERIVREVMAEKGAAAGATQAALVAMTPNGRVRAMVGGLDYGQSQFNRATDAKRQPGSTFKLFVYMTALILGASPDSVVQDEPIDVGGWTPENFDGRSHGPVTLREAFAKSYNQAAARVGQEVGVDRIVEVAQRFGIEAELKPTPSLALGTSEVTLLDMTEAFAAVRLGRTPVNATGIETLRLGEEGDSLGVTGVAEPEQTPLTRTQEPMMEMLRAVVEGGTGHAAEIPGLRPWGKTGTSQESRDAWFIGGAGGLVVGVWVGNDDNSPMDRVTGGGLPAEIFRRVVVTAQGEGTLATQAPAQQAQAGAAAQDQRQARPVQAEAPQCHIRRCAAAYRSFRASDCTYQPFMGPRRLCTR
ncbi:Multimodular transpeptidase-transglycosylase [Rubellimicrobium mesophilum DSM 19309]|uniref:Lectin-like protein BA14k n=1 Tax=Rubellimicrobium mesophilum DSM 19309 TaxID=442562 RepID=A0A017HJ16_9RHOB|nr:Multimodular transpeptidase-transglycosylase [Rubellimicrobium mesophilum DSM 19309]